MRVTIDSLLMSLTISSLIAVAACGDSSSGPVGGMGGTGDADGNAGTGGAASNAGTGGTGATDSTKGFSVYDATCDVDFVALTLPLILNVELAEEFTTGATIDTTVSGSATLDEDTVELVNSLGATSVTIESADITTTVTGAASPAGISTRLPNTPTDIDLTADPDNNGRPGPFTFELEPITVPVIHDGTSEWVDFGLDDAGFDLLITNVPILETLAVPDDCVGEGTGITGQPVSFPSGS